MNIQRWARIAGVLLLVSLVAGGFGEAYAPSKIIVSGDAVATAANIRNFEFLYRLIAGRRPTRQPANPND